MSCGCPDNTPDQEKATFDRVNLNTPPCNPDAAVMSGCTSTKGLLYDKLTEQFTVPAVGSEAYMEVCEASRWSIAQFVAVNLGNNKIASFKITDRRAKKIKVLNGCDKSGLNGIFGNPEPGTIIKADTLIYPIAPTGCESDLAAKIIDTIRQFGTETIEKVISDSDSICLTSTPVISEDEEVHLFGGTTPDCDCAPEEVTSSCLRKLPNIKTSSAGRTLRLPLMPTAVLNNPDSVPGVVLVTPEGDLHEGPTLAELRSCASFSPAAAIFPALVVCDEGVSKLASSSGIGSQLFGTKVEEEGERVDRIESRGRRFAIIEYSLSGNVGGGSATNNDWFTRPLNKIKVQSGSLVTLASNIFTITKPGKYMVRFFCTFMNTEDSQCRLINTVSSGEVYAGSAAFSNEATAGAFADCKSMGSCIIEVADEETKSFKMEYRVEITRNNEGLGRAVSFAAEVVFAQVEIIEM